MTRTLLTTVLLTALVASVAIGQTVPSTQTKITAQLVTDLIRSSDSALAERDGRATAMSALLRVAADMELLEILIAQRQLTADVALAGAHQNASPGAANVATGDYYNALGVAVGAYQNAITHAQASRSNRWSQIYTQGQQDLVNATQADLNGAVAAVQSAQTTLNNAVANQPPPTPQPPVTPVTGGPGVAVLGDQNYRKPATITSLSTGKRRPVSLVSIGVAQAPDGTAFAYGSHMAQPTTVGATTGGTTSWSSGYGYGQETWIVPAGAIRDEAGETYIIGYMTSPLRNAKGEMVKVALPKTKLSVGDALWLDRVDGLHGWRRVCLDQHGHRRHASWLRSRDAGYVSWLCGRDARYVSGLRSRHPRHVSGHGDWIGAHAPECRSSWRYWDPDGNRLEHAADVSESPHWLPSGRRLPDLPNDHSDHPDHGSVVDRRDLQMAGDRRLG